MRSAILSIANALGVNWLARAVHPQSLRILGYHGYSIEDEHLFRPMLFMRKPTFASRLNLLQANGYSFVSLDEGLDRLQAGEDTSKLVTITIDDGFYSVLTEAVPVLESYKVPATLYVSTYYAQKQSPIFRLVVFYMAWKAKANRLDLAVLGARGKEINERHPEEAFETFLWRIVEFFEKQGSEPERVAVTQQIGLAWGLDTDQISRSRAFSLLSLEEIAQVETRGVSVQLHTHRHQFPSDPESAANELSVNAKVLGEVTNAPLTHFCYPSGLWQEEHLAVLRSAHIRSAVTCELGINFRDTDPLLLSRVLDAENTAPEEFLAEVSGLKAGLRRISGVQKSLTR